MGREMGCNKSCKAGSTDNQLRQQVRHGNKVVATSQKLLHSTPLGQSKDPRLTPLTCTNPRISALTTISGREAKQQRGSDGNRDLRFA